MRTGIVACLSLLIVFAMLLINVVMVKFAERDLIDAKVKIGHLLIHDIGQRVVYEMMKREDALNSLLSDFPFRQEMSRLLRMGGFSRVLMVNTEGVSVFSVGSWENSGRDVPFSPTETLRTQQSSLEFLGETWGVFWFVPERIRISAPVVFRGRTIGAVAIGADLNSLYLKLRTSQNLILGYICLNTIILVLFGIYLLSRNIIKPIHRLLTITEKVEEWPMLFPAGESSKNEIGQLFRSLKMMLHRLEANKKELTDNIASLEKANLEIKKAQDDIIKSEKMASAGRLATGVAHEIGNPLGIILGYLELLKRSDLNRGEREDFVERIETEVTRINQIIRGLLDFSRPSSAEYEETGVHQLIKETVSMLEPQPMMDQVDIQLDLKAKKDVVWAGTDQLKQVFLNIIMNAADAMAEADMSSDGDFSKILVIGTANTDQSIVITFTDTGAGIPPEAIDRIFDPFYTTKEPGKGTGLGLSVCYTIMKGLGGAIRAESSPGKGTRIMVDMPFGSTIDY